MRKVKMNFYAVICLGCLVINLIQASKTTRIRHRSNFLTMPSKPREITIPVVVHVDFKLTKKLAKENGFKTRKKIKGIVLNILNDANELFRHPSLNQSITLKLIDTKFYRNTKAVIMDENGSNYLRSFCERQSHQKILKKKMYYSILLTGLDIFYIKNGKAVRASTARSYTNGICSTKKSCAVIEWDPKKMGYLVAHEIGHSLGIPHDGYPFNNCESFKGIMKPRYGSSKIPKLWSPCSRVYFEDFLRSKKSDCIIKDDNGRLKYTFV